MKKLKLLLLTVIMCLSCGMAALAEGEDGLTREEADEYNETLPLMHNDEWKVEWNGANGGAESGISRARAVMLPESYDLREQGELTSIKNQSPYGSCWTFATMASIESNILKNGGTAKDLSEWQLAYFFYNNPETVQKGLEGDANINTFTVSGTKVPDIDTGGNRLFTSFSLMKQTGAVDETKAPYATVISDENAKMDDSLAYENNSQEVYNVSWASLLEPDTVKNLILSKGAVVCSFWCDTYYMNMETHGYYINDIDEALDAGHTNAGGHEVAIVGWDDNYSASNFGTSENPTQPSSNGAWLVRNSWGTYSSFDNQGYFWLSYEDTSMDEDVVSYEAKESGKYDNVYQYDGTSSLQTRSSYGNKYYMSNAFVADSAEVLKSISFFTYEENDQYSIQVYTDLTATGQPASGTKQFETEQVGTMTYAGYHTVDLQLEVNLAKDERYAIVIKVWNNSEDYIYMAVDKSYQNSNWIQFINETDIGQSYYSRNGTTWTDLNGEKSNARIKAYTNELQNISRAVVNVDPVYCTGTGAEVKPTSKGVKVTYNNNAIEASDYEVTYGLATKDVGDIGTVTITGKGLFYGTKTVEYVVYPEQFTYSATYGKTANSIEFTISTLSTLADVEYIVKAGDVEEKIAQSNFSEDNSCTLEGLHGGATYDVSVQAVYKPTDEKEYITDGTGTPSCAASIDFSKAVVTLPKVYATGEEVKPAEKDIVVKMNDDVIDETLYEITYEKTATQVGEAGTVVCKGKGQYIGQASATYMVSPGSFTYTASADSTPGQIVIAFDTLSAGASQYKITVGTKTYTVDAATIEEKKSYVVSDLAGGQSYNIKVRAIYSDGSEQEAKKVETSGTGNVTVMPKAEPVKVSSLSIIGDSKKIAYGKKLQLTAKVLPSNAANKSVTWKSSNTTYATVTSSGKVTTKKAGKGKSVTITAMAKDGSNKSAAWKIKIMKGKVTKVTITGAKPVKAGKTLKLKAKVSATSGAYKTLKWTSLNTKYATVSSSGKVKTKAAGKGKTVKIKAVALDGSGKSKTVKVKLK